MRTGFNIALIIAYAWLVPIVGLFTTTGGYLAIHMIYLGIRPWPLVLAITLGAVAVMYGFFGYLLGVEMNGTWFP